MAESTAASTTTSALLPIVGVRRRRQRQYVGWPQAGAWVVLIVATIVALFPMYWLFSTAITPTTYTIAFPPDVLPVHASIDNFRRLFALAADYPLWFRNSALVTLGITAFHVIADTMAGYAFAKKSFPGKRILFTLILSTIMVPDLVTVLPRWEVMHQLHLLNTLWAVFLPGTANVFGVFLMRQYIQTLPGELEEAATVDGCSELQVFTKVVLPLCKPAIAALAIFTFVRYWNDYLWPLIVLQSSPSYTLPVGVASLQGEFATDYGVIFAGAALAALPMLVFFVVFQRYFLEGVRMGALK